MGLRGPLQGQLYFFICRCSYLTRNTPKGLHGPLQGQLYFFICRCCSYLTGNTPMGVRGPLQGQLYFLITAMVTKPGICYAVQSNGTLSSELSYGLASSSHTITITATHVVNAVSTPHNLIATSYTATTPRTFRMLKGCMRQSNRVHYTNMPSLAGLERSWVKHNPRVHSASNRNQYHGPSWR
jgi:hypothetical protein